MAHFNTSAPSCSCGCSSGATCEPVTNKGYSRYIPSIVSFGMLAVGILLDYVIRNTFFTSYIRLAWYILAYLPVGIPVMKEAFETIRRKDLFNEFTLMTIATLGAFFIGEYPEGVGVMLFYSVGELFQESAVNKAKRNIKALLDIRPDSATVYRNNEYLTVSPAEVSIGEIIQVKAGEKVPLDGKMVSQQSSFNTSALTGESKPKTLREGETVLAGMLNLDKVIEIQVEKTYEDSSLSRILAMVQDATSRKAKTELFIRKFARIYTPIVFFLALAIIIFPYFIVADYVFDTWLYRGLVFLVISCPCALVVSIPLGYFGGIGAASKNGILFKGANYLDMLPSVNTIVMDKTGTLTKGVFNVQHIVTARFTPNEFMQIAGGLESSSNHPIARAITQYNISNNIPVAKAENVEEIAGHGLKGIINGSTVLAGNSKLMNKFDIHYPPEIDSIVETVVLVAIDANYVGYITIADEVKPDAPTAVAELRKQNINVVMLSGDKTSITQSIAAQVGIDPAQAYGNLLPEDKLRHVEEIKQTSGSSVAFVGDGINDAPVLALSDIGIAMGGMGADAAIEIADVIIQTDQPSKINTAIRIAKDTKAIIMQNIVMALGIKILIMALSVFGFASMWGAVFADVGVALLAILNAVRILQKKY